MSNPKATASFAHEPRTEQEVVCLFGALLQHLDLPLTIDQVRTPFPDCLARDARSGKPYRIEFRVSGHHFIQHCHNADECDMIVCWIDDVKQWPDSLKVLELREVVRTKCPSMTEHISDREPRTCWDEGSFIEACRNRFSDNQLKTIKSILTFAALHKLGPEWLSDPKGSFAFGDSDQFFKVYTDGSLAFPFSRLSAGDLFPQLVCDLNDAFGEETLFDTDCSRKGIGGDVSKLFPTPEHLRKFLSVWQSFATQRK